MPRTKYKTQDGEDTYASGQDLEDSNQGYAPKLTSPPVKSDAERELLRYLDSDRPEFHRRMRDPADDEFHRPTKSGKRKMYYK